MNLHRKNSFVNRTRLALLCEKSGTIFLVLVGLMAGWPLVGLTAGWQLVGLIAGWSLAGSPAGQQSDEIVVDL